MNLDKDSPFPKKDSWGLAGIIVGKRHDGSEPPQTGKDNIVYPNFDKAKKPVGERSFEEFLLRYSGQ